MAMYVCRECIEAAGFQHGGPTTYSAGAICDLHAYLCGDETPRGGFLVSGLSRPFMLTKNDAKDYVFGQLS